MPLVHTPHLQNYRTLISCATQRQTGIPWDSWWWLWVRSWRTATFPTLASHTNCPGTPARTAGGLRQRTQTAENRRMEITWSMHLYSLFAALALALVKGHLSETKYADNLDFLYCAPKTSWAGSGNMLWTPAEWSFQLNRDKTEHTHIYLAPKALLITIMKPGGRWRP